jgi:5-methylcytosine-specific restriction protein B
MVYYLNKNKIDVTSLGAVVYSAIEFLTKNGKTLEIFANEVELDFGQKLLLLKPINDYKELLGRDIDRYSKEFITDVNDEKFYVSTQWGKTSDLQKKWNNFIGYCSDNDLEILNEREFEILNKLNNIVNEININKEILKNPKPQKKIKSNISIKRIDKKLPPLWIQINTQNSSVGNKIKLSYIFKNNHLIEIPFKGNAEQQAYKYVCPDEEIKSIIYNYAELQKIKEIKENKKKTMNTSKNQILYGPPGTGKTYSTVSLALDILGASDRKNDINSISELKEEFGDQVEFVTFHQSFSYEDFVEGLKAETSDGKVVYDIKPGIFKRICKNAKDSGNNSLENFKISIQKLKELTTEKPLGLKTVSNKNFTFSYQGKTTFRVVPESSDKEFNVSGYKSGYPVNIDGIIELYKNPEYEIYNPSYAKAILQYLIKENDLKAYQETTDKKPHILIIDEINRGNISQIFGELITLLEETKRTGQKEAITLQLPYSKESFSVPDNLYIIGTMNTADRSLTMMDTALRRRFDFIEILPNPHLEQISVNCGEVNLQQLLKTINERIEILYDREYLIGHSFLMNINDLQSLRNAFKNKILPLLEEYFYDDFEKINLVLGGESFYKKQTKKLGEFEKDIYIKQDIEELEAQAFTQIYAT